VMGGMSSKKSGLNIKGGWVENYGAYITITDTQWYEVASWGTSIYTIADFQKKYIIMQNPADDSYNPNLWTKVEYHKQGDGWGFCKSVYDAATQADALAADTSAIYNSADADAGCNGFGHSVSTAFPLPLIGSYADNFGATLEVSKTEWKSVASWGTSIYSIEAWGNDWVLMQNPADDAYNPSKWTLAQFHAVGSDGTFGYCMSVYDGATPKATLAVDTTSLYDGTNADTGCNGFGHTIASPA